jgi:hypothetical protein
VGGPIRRPAGAPAALAGLPRFLVFNLQLASYEPRVFGGPFDGPGLSVVLVHELVQHGARAAPHTHPLLQRFFANGVEEGGDRTRDRLKIIPKITNVDEAAAEAGMSGATKAFMAAYEGKPMMTKPQHHFYRGPGYLEVDLDAHNYAYISRKGMHSYRPDLDKMVMDCAFVIQGNRTEDLPEQVLAATRVHRVHFDGARPGPWTLTSKSSAAAGSSPQRAVTETSEAATASA